jgi:hypothetical protein
MNRNTYLPGQPPFYPPGLTPPGSRPVTEGFAGSSYHHAPSPLPPAANPGANTISHQAFNYNRSMIPGLGLGSSGSGPVQAFSLIGRSNAPPSAEAAPISHQAPSSAETRTAPVPSAGYVGTRPGSSEEGEVSDEGFEDLYEPAETAVPTSAPLAAASKSYEVEVEDDGEVRMEIDKDSSISSRAGKSEIGTSITRLG